MSLKSHCDICIFFKQFDCHKFDKYIPQDMFEIIYNFSYLFCYNKRIGNRLYVLRKIKAKALLWEITEAGDVASKQA